MQANVKSIMEIPELESLRSLVFRLRGEKEVIKPPLGKVLILYHYNLAIASVDGKSVIVVMKRPSM